jgi:hypothetical protein
MTNSYGPDSAARVPTARPHEIPVVAGKMPITSEVLSIIKTGSKPAREPRIRLESPGLCGNTPEVNDENPDHIGSQESI